MSDPFIGIIASTMTTAGYTCVECTEPKYRDYDSPQPTLYISPIKKTIISWIVFNTINVRQVYELAYIFPNNIDTTIADNNIFDFKNSVITNFMGINAALNATRAWNTKVEDVIDYNRQNLRKGYTYSIMRVLIDYIQN